MSHPEQQAFFHEVARVNDALIEGSRVLEIGSYDVNGTVRAIFGAAHEYVGVDLQAGPGVDLVCFGHEVDEPDGAFDLALSGECFEHDPNWELTLGNMIRLTRPGGMVAFTCASRGRPEHGTRRTAATDSPGTQSLGLDYYRNLEASDLEHLRLSEAFSEYAFWYMPTSFDLYFAGVRAGASTGAQLPRDSQVQQLRTIMPIAHRAVRLPLRWLRAAVKDEAAYQAIARPYWRATLRLGSAAGEALPRLKRNPRSR